MTTSFYYENTARVNIFLPRLAAIVLGLLLVNQNALAAALATTSTSLSVSPGTTVTQGAALTLQASVQAGGVPVTRGSVTFYDGASTIASAQLVSTGSAYPQGTANCKVRIGPGSHALKAVFGGTNVSSPSSSPPATVTVTNTAPTASTTAITSSGAPGNYALTATVTVAGGAPLTGPVSFADLSNANLTVATASPGTPSWTTSWPAPVPYNSGGDTFFVVADDLNGNGIPDLVVSNLLANTVSVLFGNGDGTFQTAVDYSAGSSPFGMAVGDLNGDGVPDLVVASHNSSTVLVFLGNGDGTFQAAQTFATSGISQYAVLGDFNGDGILDIATSSGGNSSASVLIGNGDGTFQTAQAIGSGPLGYGLAAADFNRDGHLDLAVTNGNGSTVSIFLGNGDGTFQPAVNYNVGSAPVTLAAADLNADGNPDLVVANFQSATISVLLGNGDGTFHPKTDYATCSSPWGVAVVDTNQDGFLDAEVACPVAHSVQLFLGKGDGSLSSGVGTFTANNYWLACADLDGDGVLDIALPDLLASRVFAALGSATETATATATAISIPGGGSHEIAAIYAGDANSSSSSSTPIAMTGSPLTTTLGLSVLSAPGPGQTFVLTGSLSPANSSGYTATGTITFLEGSMQLGAPVTLSNGMAVLSKSDFTRGNHSVTATYSGDTNFLSASSPVVVAKVIPDYSITANPNALTIRRGQTGTSVLTIAPTIDFSGQISFACTGLPAFTTCSFSPATLALPGDNVAHTVQFSLATPVSGSAAIISAWAGLVPFGFLALVFRSRRGHAAKATIGFLCALTLASCGSGTHQPPLGTSTVTMTASAADGATQRSVSIAVTISR